MKHPMKLLHDPQGGTSALQAVHMNSPDHMALISTCVKELIGKNTFHPNVFASEEEAISSGIKHLMLKIKYLTL